MLLQLFRTHRSSSSSSSSTLMPPLSILRSTRSTSTTGTTGVPKKFLAVPYPYHAEVKVQVQSLNAQGLGVGVAVDPQHPARTRTIHVPKVWPGEVVIARIYRNVAGSNVSEADLVRVEVPSPERVQPICRYYSSCSGCQLQHVGIEAQHLWKRQQVLDGLKATGCDLSKAELNEVISTAPEHTHAYRSKITPQVSYHKIRKEDGSLIDRVDDVETYANRALRIGFQIVNSRRVLDIDECILATKDVNDELHSFREKMTRTHEKNSALAVAIPRKKRRMQLLSSQLFRDDLRGSVHSDPNALITQNVGGLNFTYKAGIMYIIMVLNGFFIP
jgi:tRNA/tmRNA/rRNA uracil-C5-methylase (TrmA/RlmC/RlmD family)